jgi:hypothetical protein
VEKDKKKVSRKKNRKNRVGTRESTTSMKRFELDWDWSYSPTRVFIRYINLSLLQGLTIISCPNLLDVYSVVSLCHLNLIDGDRACETSKMVGTTRYMA